MPEYVVMRLKQGRCDEHMLPDSASVSDIYASRILCPLKHGANFNPQPGTPEGATYLRLLSIAAAELLLLEQQRPYFKVYPEFVKPLAATKLDVPCKYCKLPYSAFEIRLPKTPVVGAIRIATQHESSDLSTKRVSGRTMQPRSILVYSEMEAFKLVMPAVNQLVERYAPQDKMIAFSLERIMEGIAASYEKSGIRELGVVILGEMHGELQPLSPMSFVIPLQDDKTVEEVLLQRVDGQGRDVSEKPVFNPHEVFGSESEGVRLILSIMFLATNHDKLIEPDVLSKDLAKFSLPETDEATIRKLHEKASQRRGEGKGYTVGRRERLLHVVQQRSLGDEEGYELTHQHQRCGHIHRFHKGGGVIYKWIPQLTVRPDLPVNKEGSAGIVLK